MPHQAGVVLETSMIIAMAPHVGFIFLYTVLPLCLRFFWYFVMDSYLRGEDIRVKTILEGVRIYSSAVSNASGSVHVCYDLRTAPCHSVVTKVSKKLHRCLMSCRPAGDV